MAKKIGTIITTLLMTVVLTACGSSIHEDLQANDWNVVSTNGESYQASFHEDTITIDLQIYQRGFQYTVDEENDTLTWKADEESPTETFNVTKTDNGFTFEAQKEEVQTQYGDLTLTPIETEE